MSVGRANRSASGWDSTCRTVLMNDDSGLRGQADRADVVVPAYLPDTDVVRGDLLDYGVEVEWADKHRPALGVLEAAGELDRTLILSRRTMACRFRA